MSALPASAVTGMGVVCALGHDVETFAAALRAGRSAIVEVGGDGDAPRFAAPLREFAFADALGERAAVPESLRRSALRLAGRAPRPVQVALVAALQAWEAAGLAERPLPADRVGLVVAGHNLTSRHGYELGAKFRGSPAHVPPRFALQMLDTDHVGTVSHVLGIAGEGFTVGGASASGNVGIIMGSRLVESGAVDACLVVGALVELSPVELRALANVGAMACDGAGAPFDASHGGFVLGEGAACLVVERVASAHARKASVAAFLAGYDQRLCANSLADPSEAGEAASMTNAIHRAGLTPARIDYVNAHGTSSALGDETEVLAMRRVFAANGAGPWVNSTKALAGHCLGAAGVVEAVATIVQMRDGFVHGNPDLVHPIDARCRFVGRDAEPVRVEHALSNSFGFGGFATSVLLAHPEAASPA